MGNGQWPAQTVQWTATLDKQSVEVNEWATAGSPAPVSPAATERTQDSRHHPLTGVGGSASGWLPESPEIQRSIPGTAVTSRRDGMIDSQAPGTHSSGLAPAAAESGALSPTRRAPLPSFTTQIRPRRHSACESPDPYIDTAEHIHPHPSPAAGGRPPPLRQPHHHPTTATPPPRRRTHPPRALYPPTRAYTTPTQHLQSEPRQRQ